MGFDYRRYQRLKSKAHNMGSACWPRLTILCFTTGSASARCFRPISNGGALSCKHGTALRSCARCSLRPPTLKAGQMSGCWGCGAQWQGQWFQVPWLSLPLASECIAVKELFPIVVDLGMRLAWPHSAGELRQHQYCPNTLFTCYTVSHLYQ